MELEDRHARSSYGSLTIMYHTFRVDELIGHGISTERKLVWDEQGHITE